MCVITKERERERDVGIICVIIYDGLALKAWTQRRERERERAKERGIKEENFSQHGNTFVKVAYHWL